MTSQQQTAKAIETQAALNWNAANPTKIPIDVNTFTSIGTAENSTGDPNAVGSNTNGTTDNGLMQLNSAYYAADFNPASNAATAASVYGNYVQQAGGNNATSVSAYHTGSVNHAIDAAYVNKVSAAGSGIGGSSSGTTSGTTVQVASPPTPTASTYVPLSNNSASVDQSTLVPTIIVTTGLDAVAWYNDKGLITGNPRLRKEVQPVSFQVLLHSGTDFILSSGGSTGTPISIQLNASMKSINWTMKHNYHHQRTRTAHHITIWGMNADIIEGSCTTGVFMNQLGITDYYSTRTINDSLKTLVTNGLMFKGTSTTSISSSTLTQAKKEVLGEGGITGGSVSVSSSSGGTSFQTVMSNLASSNSNFTQTDAFRVAAQDAFAEFLALFKMNGNVWFWNKSYEAGVGSTRSWDGIQAWSPIVGMNGSQMNARNNDVITRGGVILNYRNYVYQGYFKSLQWTMDARNPFQWNFNFVFQVEKTVGNEYIPA